tara:strand:+ start:1103 stop:1810 length:708 start_codon:yes stop_codon:yes gene_type:complete
MKKKILAIIPAKQFSKGLKNKNMITLAGKPLIDWTIDRAIQSKLISKIVLSSDSSKIISHVKKKYKNSIDIPFKRAKKLSTFSSPIYKTILHAINFYKKQNINYDLIVLLEPTSPIRFKNDIDKAIKTFLKVIQKYDTLISVGKMKYSPLFSKKIIGNNLLNFYKTKKKNLNRQNFESLFFPFGVIYISKVKSFEQKKTFYVDKKMTFYKIKDNQCFEIDDVIDLKIVKTILKEI